MYLATERIGSDLRYTIRQSREVDENLHDYTTVFDLGKTPSRFFTIIEEHIVIFNDELLSSLREHGERKAEAVLEKILFAFFPDSVQRRLSTFRNRSGTYQGKLTPIERQQIVHQIHLFDRRRLYYLRYGAVDQSRLSKLHEKCCRPLIGQSRDEREFYFKAEERVIDPGSFFQYIYAIFNLNRHFHQSFAPWLPEALASHEVADHFVKAICTLQQDSRFWQAEANSQTLHPHLQRYIWMFFDFAPHTPSFQRDFMRRFMGSRRNFKWPEKKVQASTETIEEIFGKPFTILQKMTKRELTRLYRKKAMQLHPDTGGDAQTFITLTEIYTTLTENKKE